MEFLLKNDASIMLYYKCNCIIYEKKYEKHSKLSKFYCLTAIGKLLCSSQDPQSLQPLPSYCCRVTFATFTLIPPQSVVADGHTLFHNVPSKKCINNY